MRDFFLAMAKDAEALKEDLVKLARQMPRDEDLEQLRSESREPLIKSFISRTEEEARSMDIFTEEGRANVVKLYMAGQKIADTLARKGTTVLNESFVRASS
jgi:hypothetical protein